MCFQKLSSSFQERGDLITESGLSRRHRRWMVFFLCLHVLVCGVYWLMNCIYTLRYLNIFSVCNREIIGRYSLMWVSGA